MTHIWSLFFYKWTQKHTSAIDAFVLYSASTVVSSVASLCFIFKLIKSRKLIFYGVHSCLSPVEIQDLTPPPPPHAFGIPIVTMPPCPSISSSKTNPSTPLLFKFQRAVCGMVWYGKDIFWNCNHACLHTLMQTHLSANQSAIHLTTDSTPSWFMIMHLIYLLNPHLFSIGFCPNSFKNRSRNWTCGCFLHNFYILHGNKRHSRSL